MKLKLYFHSYCSSDTVTTENPNQRNSRSETVFVTLNRKKSVTAAFTTVEFMTEQSVEMNQSRHTEQLWWTLTRQCVLLIISIEDEGLLSTTFSLLEHRPLHKSNIKSIAVEKLTCKCFSSSFHLFLGRPLSLLLHLDFPEAWCKTFPTIKRWLPTFELWWQIKFYLRFRTYGFVTMLTEALVSVPSQRSCTCEQKESVWGSWVKPPG